MTNGTKGERGDFFLPLGKILKPKWRKACNDIGISQIKAGQRLVEWFVKQPREVQLRALGMLEDAPPVAPLRRRATRKPKGG